MTDIVIGSGPSGIAVAHGLLARGRQVLMLDGGKVLEPDRAANRDRMAAQPPENWAKSDRDQWQEPQFAAASGQVRRFGSDFAMEPASATFAEGAADFALRSSRAVGGLSNLWGSATLPYRAADMSGWPISADDLAPHYRALSAFVPTTGRRDDLDRHFPAQPITSHDGLTPSPQAMVLLERLDRAKDRLAALGLTTGQARQAVATGCRLCGQCLHGCPWGLIWSAQPALGQLPASPRFTYRAGAVVTQFEETADSVKLLLSGGETLRGQRIFMAAGVLETARILLASQPRRGQLTLRDSQHGFLPALHLWRANRRPDRGPYHTLAQVFAELEDAAVSPYLVHAQLYTWNEFFEQDLIANYAHFVPGSARFWRALARRLIVAQLFLHSDHSASVTLALAPDGRLTARPEPNPRTPAVFAAAAQALSRGLRLAGLAPLGFARRMAPVGSSFHAGATVPMAKTPSADQSDIWGRPYGLARVHLVDSSSLSAIPATTITLAVMANAHRIGALAP